MANNCSLSLPVSAIAAGLFAGDVYCINQIQWGLRAGAAAMGFSHWVPFIRGRIGVSFPPVQPYRENSPKMTRRQVSGSLGYVFLQNTAFRGTHPWRETQWLLTPSIQQWALLTDSDVSLEFTQKTQNSNAFFDAYSLKLWQTLPRAWRVVGALRDTEDTDLAGMAFLASVERKNWRARFGLGRALVTTDRLAATFFYPTIELAYHLRPSPVRNERFQK